MHQLYFLSNICLKYSKFSFHVVINDNVIRKSECFYIGFTDYALNIEIFRYIYISTCSPTRSYSFRVKIFKFKTVLRESSESWKYILLGRWQDDITKKLFSSIFYDSSQDFTRTITVDLLQLRFQSKFNVWCIFQFDKNACTKIEMYHQKCLTLNDNDELINNNNNDFSKNVIKMFNKSEKLNCRYSRIKNLSCL
jgi:hypothetical protein